MGLQLHELLAEVTHVRKKGVVGWGLGTWALKAEICPKEPWNS